MKPVLLTLAVILFFASNICSQNVGINTNTPGAALDINGDIIIRPANLAVADGITLALDVNTLRFSNYRITGPTANFTLAGIAAGIDGRLITLLNLSGFVMQLNNEDATAAPADMIVTGTNTDITIVNKGIVNLQYDATEQKWIIKSSSKGTVSGGGGFWDASGNNIFNNNTGNVGIGTNAPLEKLTVQTLNNTNGISHRGEGGNILSTRMGGTSAGIGTFSATNMRIFANGISRILIAEATGNVGIGTDNPAVPLSFPNTFGNKISFWNTGPNNDYGIGINAGVMQLFTAGTDKIAFGWGNANAFNEKISFYTGSGQVGINTTNVAGYQLAVNGNIRSKEVVVETGWADYVFEKNYQLPLLSDVEKFIQKNKHLPNIPSAAEIEKTGLHLGDTQKRMMEKIEELTLYIIQQQKEIDVLKEKINNVNKIIK